MCLLSPCTVASKHEKKCCEVASEGEESDTKLLCISCTPVGGSGKQLAVFLEPTLPSAIVREDYLTAV